MLHGRRKLPNLDLARQVQELMSTGGCSTIEAAAEELGISRSKCTRALRVLMLPVEVIEYLTHDGNDIPLIPAQRLVRLIVGRKSSAAKVCELVKTLHPTPGTSRITSLIQGLSVIGQRDKVVQLYFRRPGRQKRMGSAEGLGATNGPLIVRLATSAPSELREGIRRLVLQYARPHE